MEFLADDEEGNAPGLRWQSSALLALQEATEACVSHFSLCSVSLQASRDLIQAVQFN